MTKTALAILSAGFILANAMPASANLITNGGFENQPGFTGNPYDYSTSPAGWMTDAAWNANGYNAVAGSVYGQPHSGSYDVRFGSSSSTAPTTLSQTISDIVGAFYTVRFYAYNGASVGNSTSQPDNYLTASMGGQSLSVADNLGTYSNGCSTCWTLQSFGFKGTGTDTLSFAARTDTNYWFLDDVSVTLSAASAVPEPASWTMMAIGLCAIAGRLRRRRSTPTIA